MLRYTIDGRDPTPGDAIYSAPFRFKGNGQVRVRAFRKGFAPSPVATAFFAEDPFVGNGDGLSAEYFPGRELAGTGIQRTDVTIDTRAPADALKLKPEDEWSARWTGQVQAQFTNAYSFYTVSDDGIRLWVNGKLLIDDWSDHAPTEDRGTIQLERGKRYDIKLEYYNGGGGAECHLSWSTPASPKVLVPQTQLYSR